MSPPSDGTLTISANSYPSRDASRWIPDLAVMLRRQNVPTGHASVNPSAELRGLRKSSQASPVWKTLSKSQAGSWKSPWRSCAPCAGAPTVMTWPLWHICTLCTGTCALLQTICDAGIATSNAPAIDIKSNLFRFMNTLPQLVIIGMFPINCSRCQ